MSIVFQSSQSTSEKKENQHEIIYAICPKIMHLRRKIKFLWEFESHLYIFSRKDKVTKRKFSFYDISNHFLLCIKRVTRSYWLLEERRMCQNWNCPIIKCRMWKMKSKVTVKWENFLCVQDDRGAVILHHKMPDVQLWTLLMSLFIFLSSLWFYRASNSFLLRSANFFFRKVV